MVELTMENKKYKICYFCAEDLHKDQNVLECGHQFCCKCLSNLQSYSILNSNCNYTDNFQHLQSLFRAAQASTKTNSNSELNSNELSRKYSESQLTSLLLKTENSAETMRKLQGNVSQQQPIKCLVCRKVSHSISSDHIPDDWQSLNDLSPMSDRLRCDCCMHKGRQYDDQIIEADFFCQKCSLNLCHKCRDVHDETTLFHEHPVIPVRGNNGGVERLCRRHNNLAFSYFCINCRRPLCSLCVLFHQNASGKNLAKSSCIGLKTDLELNSPQSKISEHHRLSDRQPNLLPEKHMGTRVLENHTLLRAVVSDDTFQCNPDHTEDANCHNIVKFREALAMVREHLKSGLNQLGPQLNAMKDKLRSFCYLQTEGIPNPADAAYSSSSSSSTLSPPPIEPSDSLLKKQNSFKKKHCLTNEKNVMSKLLRSTAGCKEPELRLGRFRLSKSKKLSHGNFGVHNNLITSASFKVELATPIENNSDGSDCNSWSSDTSANHLKLFRNFRKKFQTSIVKNSSNSSDNRKSSECETHSRVISVANASHSNSSGRKNIWRKLSTSSAVYNDTRIRTDSMSGQEQEFVNSSKMLISKYLKLFEVASRALESSQSKTLYEIYENFTRRIHVIIEDELSLLEEEISKRTTQRRERLRIIGNRSSDNLKRLVCRQETCVATLAIKSAGLIESFSGLTVNPLSQTMNAQEDELTEIWSSRRTLLARPFQRWKYERTKTDLESSSIPTSAILVDEGRIAVVAEYDNSNIRNNRLQLLDGSNGNYIDSILPGQIQPLGMALNKDQHLVVTDCKGKRVKIISLETKATIAEMGKGMFGWPCGVAVTSKGQIVVSDVFNDCIFIFSSDGKRLKTFGSSGSHQDKLRNPYHLTIDSRDRIYVSDSSNGCIKIFDTSGNLQFTSTEIVRHHSVIQDSMNDRKAMNRKLRDPRGVAVDECGNFFVADDYSRVCMFDSCGKFVRYLLTEEDSLKSPESLSYHHTSQDGLLLLTEWAPSNLYSVKLFSLYQNM